MTQSLSSVAQSAARQGAIGVAIVLGVTIVMGQSAFAASSVRYGQNYTGDQTAQFLAYAGAKGPVLLAVQNHPFDRATVDRVVAQSATQALSIPVRFTPNPAEAAEPSWRYVLVFNPPDSANIRDACAGPVASQPRAASLDVLASLCQGSRAFAGARGTTLRSISAEDPGFARLVSEVTNTVFSASDTEDHGDGGASVGPAQSSPARQSIPTPANAGRQARPRPSN